MNTACIIIQRCFRNYLVRTKLLYNPLIQRWIKNETPFKELYIQSRKRRNGKRCNTLEKNWGNRIIKRYFNHKRTNQWSNILGEQIVLQLFKDSWRPKKKNGYLLDIETSDYIIEVKSRNYTTEGTAGEKILGVPYKYADVPKMFNKKLLIILVAYQEVEAVEKFKLFSHYCEAAEASEIQKQQILNWNKQDIHFFKASKLLEL